MTLSRKSRLSRSTPLQRGGRIKPVNRKRRRSEFARCYGSARRVQFVKALPCCVCGRFPSENAHIEGGGVSRKADYTKIIPLCHDHHRLSHMQGMREFGINFSFKPEREADRTEAAWQDHQTQAHGETRPQW